LWAGRVSEQFATGGKRADLLLRMRVITQWTYEPQTFWFEDIKRGSRSYTPDFRVQYRGETRPVYVEIKGWMDATSRTKLKRFAKYYPQHKVELIDAKAYAAIKKRWASAIPGWE
jgi:hypothetical protein